MINSITLKRLKNAWPDRELLNGYAEVRFYDELSKFECYLIAVDPEDENQIFVLLNGLDLDVDYWTMKELSECFNEHGEPLTIDLEYRPILLQNLLTKLNNER